MGFAVRAPDAVTPTAHRLPSCVQAHGDRNRGLDSAAPSRKLTDMFASRTIDIDFPHVTSVRHVAGQVLWLRFSDGVEGEVDFAGWLEGPVFEPLRDPGFFARVRGDGYTIVWPNGVD